MQIITNLAFQKGKQNNAQAGLHLCGLHATKLVFIFRDEAHDQANQQTRPFVQSNGSLCCQAEDTIDPSFLHDRWWYYVDDQAYKLYAWVAKFVFFMR